MSGQVFGRSLEMAAVREFLDGHGGAALVIEGEMGIGKSTLWLAAVEAAAAAGGTVLAARPAECERSLSYAVLGDLLDPFYDVVCDVLSEPQRSALGAALLRAETRGQPGVRAIGAAVVSSVHALAAAASVVLAVDDAQWVDAPSARVLEFAVRRRPTGVRIIACRRGTEEPLPFGLDAAWQAGHLTRLTLGPVPLAALHRIVHDRLGAALPPPWLTRVADTSGGNPLFALEFARAVLQAGTAGDIQDVLPVSATLRSFVRDRVAALSPTAKETVLTAAAMFRPTISSIGAALGPDTDHVAALAEAEAAGVLTVEGERLRFTHPVIRSVVYGSTSPLRRQRLHRLLASSADGAEERAHHLAHGVTAPDRETAELVEAGGREAAARGAHDAAATLFAAAHRLTPPDQADACARRLLGQAQALNAIGDFDGARACAERARQAAATPPTRVRASVLLADLAWYRGVAPEATALLESALLEAGDDRSLRATVSAQLVRYCFTHDFARALATADATVPLLDAEHEPALLARILIDRFLAAAYLGHPAGTEDLDRALALEECSIAAGDQPPHPMPLIWFHCMDRIEAARARFAMEELWYRERGEDVWLADRMSHAAVAELRAGRWDAAERLAEQAVAAVENVPVRGPLAMVFEKRALVDAYRGRLDRARGTLVPLIDEAERGGQAWWAALALSTLAVVESSAGHHDAADAALRRMRTLADSLHVKDVLIDRSEPWHVDALLSLGRIDEALAALDRLERRHRMHERPWIAVTLPAARALVEAAQGRLAGALDELPPVVDSGVAPFETAWAMLVHGRLLRRARQRSAAADMLGAALARFRDLGSIPWTERATAELAHVGLRPPAPTGLTEAERRVARLAGQGLTNREVAAQLFISPKTVEANLQRVYRKLGVRSRAQLGARLQRVVDSDAQA